MKLRGEDAVVAAVGRWHPGDVVLIEEATYVAETLGEPDGARARLVVLVQSRESHRSRWPDWGDNMTRLSLHFECVREFSLKSVGGTLQVAGFDIVDEADSQLDGIRYRVIDYEEGVIGLVCRDYYIDVLNAQVRVASD